MTDQNTIGRDHLRQQYIELAAKHLPWIRHLHADETYLQWHILFHGPSKSPYEEGIYLLRVLFEYDVELDQCYPTEIVFPLCPVLHHPYDYWVPTSTGAILNAGRSSSSFYNSAELILLYVRKKMLRYDDKPKGMYSIECHYAREFEENREDFINTIRLESLKSRRDVVQHLEWSKYLSWERRVAAVWLSSGLALSPVIISDNRSSQSRYQEPNFDVSNSHSQKNIMPNNILFCLPHDLSRLVTLFI